MKDRTRPKLIQNIKVTRRMIELKYSDCNVCGEPTLSSAFIYGKVIPCCKNCPIDKIKND